MQWYETMNVDPDGHAIAIGLTCDTNKDDCAIWGPYSTGNSNKRMEVSCQWYGWNYA